MEIIFGLFVLYVIYRIVKGFASNKKLPGTSGITFRVGVSGHEKYRGNYERNKRLSGKPAKWYESGQKYQSISSGTPYLKNIYIV